MPDPEPCRVPEVGGERIRSIGAPADWGRQWEGGEVVTLCSVPEQYGKVRPGQHVWDSWNSIAFKKSVVIPLIDASLGDPMDSIRFLDISAD